MAALGFAPPEMHPRARGKPLGLVLTLPPRNGSWMNAIEGVFQETISLARQSTAWIRPHQVCLN